MIELRRRTVVLGSAAVAAAVALAAVFGRNLFVKQQRLADAEADYLAGRVTLRDGWIVSESEAAERQS